MSVENQEQRVVFQGNGEASVFFFPFTIEKEDHVMVVEADAEGRERILSLGEDYSVTIAEDGTGRVTLPSPLAAGHSLALVSVIPATQERSFPNNTPYYQEQLEGALDKNTRLIQQLREETARAIRLPVTSTLTADEFRRSLFDASRDARLFAEEAKQSERRAESLSEQTAKIAESALSEVANAGDVQAVRLEQLASHILVEGVSYNREVTVVLEDALPAGTVLELPADTDGKPLSYRVGMSVLRLSCNGKSLYAGEDFMERGAEGSFSTQVEILTDLEAGSRLNVFLFSRNVTVSLDEESGLALDERKRLTARVLKLALEQHADAGDEAVEKKVEALEETLRGFIAEEVAKYLPLAGGMMEGAVKFSSNPMKDLYVDSSGSVVLGGVEDGSYLKLRGLEDTGNPGGWMLVASDGSSSHHTICYPDGRLTSAGAHVLKAKSGSGIGQFTSVKGTANGFPIPSGGTWACYYGGELYSGQSRQGGAAIVAGGTNWKPGTWESINSSYPPVALTIRIM